MTQGTGHPDWQSYAQWRAGKLVVFDQLMTPNQVLVTDPISVANWQSVLIKAAAAGSGFTVAMEVAPSVDAAAGAWYQQHTYTIPDSSNVLWTQVTPIDKAVRFRITNASGANTGEFALTAYMMNTPAMPGVADLPANWAGADGFTLASGGTKALLLPYQPAARVEVFCWAPLATVNGLTLTLALIDALGAVAQRLGRWDNVKGAVVQELVVPSGPLQLTLSNFTGGSVATIDQALTGVY